MRGPSIVLLCLLGLCAWVKPAHAAESYANCTGTVTALPAVISTSGTWCLKKNLTSAIATGDAIKIGVDNVTLDCNDFSLTGTGGLATVAVGIHAVGVFNASTRHCNVSGFQYGLKFEGTSNGHVVENNRFHGNTVAGVWVEGDGSVVRHNQVFDNGGSTATANAYGIYTNYSVNVSANTVSGVTARTGGNGNAYGIYTIHNLNGTIVDNHVSELAKDGTGKIYAIYNSGSGRIVQRGNDVFGDQSTGSVGMFCASSGGHAKDNLIGGFATALQACSDGGDNDISP